MMPARVCLPCRSLVARPTLYAYRPGFVSTEQVIGVPCPFRNGALYES
jgi:hypothetical protein